MTNEEAIKTVEALKNLEKAYRNADSDSIFSVTLKPYITLEDLCNAISASENQISKKPKRNNTIASKFFHRTFCYTCPTCGNGLLTEMMNERQNTRFCWDCGQKLDWTEGGEE